MKIGDKVRFLNEIGGGIISGFQDKNVVMVKDEDGFDIPMLIKDCVVIDSDDYNISKVVKAKQANDNNSTKQAHQKTKIETIDSIEMYDDDEDIKPITFRPRPIERREGERLNVFLAFVPVDIKDLSDTAFEAYIVNDSNYYLNFLYLSAEGANWHARFQGTIEPNTKIFIEEFKRDILNDLSHLAVQLFAYKTDKAFPLKPAISVELRPDITKFYKLHTFRRTDFFEEEVLMLDIVRNDEASRQVFVKAEELQEALLGKKKNDEIKRRMPQAARKEKPSNAPLEIDLHATEILDTTAKMKSSEILEYQLDVFRKTMNEHQKDKGMKIVFIHGKGEGVLRNAIIKELKAKYKSASYQDASFREYGFGATMVTI